ncbi:MAG: sarcosine oxidase subunit gamma family protein [Casimicrobiaceae bacterium]
MSDHHDGGIGSPNPGHHGAAGSGVVLSQAPIMAAWNVQGDPSRTSVVVDVRRLFGVALPEVANTTQAADALTALWLGPRSWLVVESARDAVPATLTDYASRRDALNAGGAALFDVSASRVAYTLRGAQAANVLARGCPLDFDARAFAPGTCAQSVHGQVAMLVYRHVRTEAFTVFVARSLADDAWQALCRASAAEGYDVAADAAFDAD